MSSHYRRKRRQRSQGNKTGIMGDVTINDFANSPTTSSRPNCRLKKPLRNVLRGERVVKSSRRKTKMAEAPNQEEDNGVRYPIDVWFLISNHISPESVGKFAGICKDSKEVVNTAYFWKSMYRRFHNSDAELPETLQPNAIGHRYGLRARVIRALHHMYRPFVMKNSKQNTPEYLQLRNLLVMSQWFKASVSDKQYTYHLKLRPPYYNAIMAADQDEDDVEVLNDILVNNDEACITVKIICSHHVNMPILIGLVLTELTFQALPATGPQQKVSYTCSLLSISGNISMQFTPVISYQILNWWHRLYPYMWESVPRVNLSDSE